MCMKIFVVYVKIIVFLPIYSIYSVVLFYGLEFTYKILLMLKNNYPEIK